MRQPWLLSPVRVVHVEDLGYCTPADVFHERGFFLVRCRAFLGIQHPQRLDGFKVPLKLLFWTAVAKAICLRDTIAIEIASRFFLMAAPVADCIVAVR